MSDTTADQAALKDLLFAELLTLGIRKIALEQLLSSLLSVRPELTDRPERLTILLEALAQLKSGSQLVLPAGKEGYLVTGSLKLPRWIRLEPAASTPKLRAFEIDWVPELSFCSQFTNQRQIQLAEAINKFLIASRVRKLLKVPLRERSLEIFGNEKQLDNMVTNGTLFNGRLSVEQLSAFEVPHYLVHEVFQKGGSVLIVENHHTFWSFCQWNRTAGAFSAVVYGAGQFLRKSEETLDNIMECAGGTGLLYFGDLDPTGFSIPIAINRVRRAQNRTALAGQRDFYNYALDHGIRVPYKGDKLSDGAAPDAFNDLEVFDELKAFIGDDLAAGCLELFASKRRIAQECLGLEVLSSGIFKVFDTGNEPEQSATEPELRYCGQHPIDNGGPSTPSRIKP